jgi:sirohydrochlorin ferrochelatase
MKAEHFEFLVEEPSMEAFLTQILPKILAENATYTIHTHQGKLDLLQKLQSRLRAYAAWLPNDWRIVVLVDRDDDDCHTLKERLESDARAAGLLSKAEAEGSAARQVVTRLAIEELEAWYFGETAALTRAYPKIRDSTLRKAAYRQCDQIAGGTWEALERVLRRAGYLTGRLPKVETAQTVGIHFDHARCLSPSFSAFRNALHEAIGQSR